VQLIGGITLHRGEIAEMRTGEGKTLVSTLAAYLNALKGEGVHIVTVNDYLAKRDAEWMGRVYSFLGMTTECINNYEPYGNARKIAYAADITYGTNNEFGFDYLRDNMKYSLEDMAQRPHAYAVIDEIDSILIDEARTPLIISGPTDDKSDFYQRIDTIIPQIREDGYEVDEKAKTATFNEEGNEQIVIPTNRPIQRIDDQDEIYRTEREKFNIIVDEIITCQQKQQPVLVGTVSIEKSEALSQVLKDRDINHKVLNARFHEEEAAIVALAGMPGAVTIATNMAGRGTDIQLGGNLEMRIEQEVPENATPEQRQAIEDKIKAEIAVYKEAALAAGGLYVLGTERHESRRIDNQLRGRTGRQGDPP